MDVSSSAEHSQPGFYAGRITKAAREDACALKCAHLPLGKLWPSSQPEADRLRREDVFKRAALKTGKDRRVDLLCDGGIVGQDKATARTAERLVGCRRRHVGVRHWIRVH